MANGVPFTFDAIPDPYGEGSYSELKVMKSGAGYYIGRTFKNPDGYDEPGTRESAYFMSEEAANEAFENGFSWRASPENFALYEKNPGPALLKAGAS